MFLAPFADKQTEEVGKKVANGVNKVANGVNKVANGVNKVANGVNKVANGVNKVANGVNKVANGVNKGLRRHTLCKSERLMMKLFPRPKKPKNVQTEINQ